MRNDYLQRFKTTEMRFWEKVKITSPDDCYEWLAGATPAGYGKFKVNGKTLGAHRVAYEMKNGLIPDGMQVCHRCDNKKCVNYRHLFLGSAADNQFDKVKKNRQSKGQTHGSAKLTEEAVLQIRKYYDAGAVTQRWLARLYGVTQILIGKIVRREIWVHI